MLEVNFSLAFVAGLFSFFAPCVIPLVPAFISYISGVSTEELTKNDSAHKYHTKVLINSLFYIAGFTSIFIILGLTATLLGKYVLINRFELLRLGGALVIVFGLYTLGVFNRLTFLQKELGIGIPVKFRHIRYLTPFLLGISFGLAWTPCIGPILGSILTLAATSDTVYSGGLLLFVYSLGITLPFLLIGFTLGHSYKLLRRLGPTLMIINKIGAILLIGLGLMMLTHSYDELTATLLKWLNSYQFYQNLQNYF